MNLDEESIQVAEQEVDNVAPKIVGILGLNESCEVSTLRRQLAEYCQEYMEQQMGSKRAAKKNEEMKD